jgi:hypothetical protein
VSPKAGRSMRCTRSCDRVGGGFAVRLASLPVCRPTSPRCSPTAASPTAPTAERPSPSSTGGEHGCSPTTAESGSAPAPAAISPPRCGRSTVSPTAGRPRRGARRRRRRHGRLLPGRTSARAPLPDQLRRVRRPLARRRTPHRSTPAQASPNPRRPRAPSPGDPLVRLRRRAMLFEACGQLGVEGIVLKKLNAPYLQAAPGNP